MVLVAHLRQPHLGGQSVLYLRYLLGCPERQLGPCFPGHQSVPLHLEFPEDQSGPLQLSQLQSHQLVQLDLRLLFLQ